ncbi:MAG TPA: PilX N-terminal domain-containing pilus assembly protein [Candidatus Aquilonibacter sp.]|nr:PilX N-terminal domain-containing pilus assembly protein [Candidatus Aquilonibacter sp.]
MRAQRESGIALITVLLLLLLVSAVIAGMTWMVMTDQRLGGNNVNRDLAFYGAEAGMEKLTADMGNQFASEGAITSTDVTTLETTPPSIPGITYTNASGGSTYTIECGTTPSPCTPTPQTAEILPPSPYAGMNAIITPFTLSVTAQDLGGGEVKLNRQLQLVAIPVFQFGVYSDSDLAFFNGPTFDFGGRTHTNGNLWLSPNSGPLFLGDKVTVVGQVIRTNLENGYPGSGSTISAGGNYSGTVSIALTPNPSSTPSGPSYSNTQWRPLALTESSVTGSSVYGNVSTTPNNPTWSNVEAAYNGMLVNGVAPLSLTSTALGGITQPIELIRRAQVGERASNPALFAERYFSQGTMRILLDDYPSGTAPGGPTATSNAACHTTDMMSLDGIDTSTDPYDLSRLANATAPSWWSSTTATYYPLATSGAASSSYTSYTSPTVGTGYWVSNGSPIITGCLKIEYQNTSGTWHDITETILNQGYVGRNINPQAAPTPCTPPRHGTCTTTPNTVAPYLTFLPSTGTVIAPQGSASITSGTVGCGDLSPNAIIRIERLRDNPANSGSSGGCGGYTNANDFWPMALFDSREGLMRPNTTLSANSDGNPPVSANGVMYYIELDAANLATWFKNNQSSLSLNNSTGFALYFSDRRTEQIDTQGATTEKTGSYGYNDFVNPNDVNNGCPNGTLDTGEDIEQDGIFRNYGGTEMLPYSGYRLSNIVSGSNLSTVLVANPDCPSSGTWPGIVFNHTNEARENSPVFFRRALKVVDGETLNLGTSCFSGGTPACGLAITSENPVYIMGDYNVPGLSMTSSSSVATSIAGDSVTLLSDNWNDVNSFISPYDYTKRTAVTTDYRVALIGGKGIPFPQIGSTQDFGTDGGLHNFLRFLEDWGSSTANYSGSLVSFYYYHQMVGAYKDGTGTYNPPNRVYYFDTNFTRGTQYLPPLTPKLKAINTIGFTQETNPTQ